jgi:peptidoglycan/LPS O-acetylase OafA/YrhL
MKSGYIKTLDGLRAVAILLVIFSHCITHERSPALAQLGHIGVSIFFALSGYLITTRLLQEYGKTGAISLKDFYIRRAFRILPPAVLFLTLLWVLVKVGVAACDPAVIRSALLFYTNYVNVDNATGWRAGHFWSLSVEEHFYLIWPFLLIAFGVRRGWITAVVFAVGLCVWRGFDRDYHIVDHAFNAPYLWSKDFRTDLCADTLLWGCSFAFLQIPNARSVVSTIAAIGFMVALFLYSIPGEYTAAFHLLPRNSNYVDALVHVLSALMLVAIVSCPTAPIGRFLELAPMRWIGHVSYSLYIWQELFLGVPDHRLPWPLGVCASFACACLSYWLVEKPFMRIGKSVFEEASRPVRGDAVAYSLTTVAPAYVDEERHQQAGDSARGKQIKA